MVETPTDMISAASALSNDEIIGQLDQAFQQKAAAEGTIVVLLGEVHRRQAYRENGATSTEAWAAERFGVSTPTARALTQVGEKAWDMPHLVESLCAGDLSFDKVRAVADVATPETDQELADQAKGCTVRELADVARASAPPQPPSGRSEHERRFLRFNEAFRTMTVQLPAQSFAETRACLEARARHVPSDGETPWDQRLCDAFLELIRTSAADASGSSSAASPYFVVVHVPIETLVDESGEASDLAGELERDGLISTEAVQQIACDATIAIGVDDDVGHTMYEGRARRTPSDAQRREVRRRDRHCRFPGCTNNTFTNIHHIVPWKPGGRTDLDNLALQCLYHHHLVHSKGWEMTGNANEELTFTGPSGRVMRSRPSPLWTTVIGGAPAGGIGPANSYRAFKRPLVGEAEVGRGQDGAEGDALGGRHRLDRATPVHHRDQQHHLGAGLLHGVGRLEQRRPAGHGVLGDHHLVARVERTRDTTAPAVVLRLLTHAEGLQRTTPRRRHTGGHEGHGVGAHGEPADRRRIGRDHREDGVSDEQHGLGAAHRLLGVDEPAALAPRLEGEVAGLDRVGQQVIPQSGEVIRPAHELVKRIPLPATTSPMTEAACPACSSTRSA